MPKNNESEIPSNEEEDNSIGNPTSENEEKEGEYEMLPKSKGKTLEEIAAEYKNKKSEKNKRRLKKYKETQNLQMREPIYWRVGKKLPSSKTEDGQKFTCYYHDRKTPEQHKQDLIQAYAEWNRIHDSGTKLFPDDLIG